MIILKKNPQKDFVVLNLSDPQLGASEWVDGHLHRTILERTITERECKEQRNICKRISQDFALQILLILI